MIRFISMVMQFSLLLHFFFIYAFFLNHGMQLLLGCGLNGSVGMCIVL